MSRLNFWHIFRFMAALVAVVTVGVATIRLFPKNHTAKIKDQFFLTHDDSILNLNDFQEIKGVSPDSAESYKPECVEESTDQKKKQSFIPVSLPQSVISGVKKFVFFLGHPRSGHSIIASLLDAHPHIIIAHEVHIFGDILQSNSKTAANESYLFNTLWRNSYYSFQHGHRSDRAAVKRIKGYTLTIEGLCQGMYQSYVEVIGDKKAGKTTALLAYNYMDWEKAFQKLKLIVGIPIKVFHCIRNPYDNIATLIIDDAVNHGSLSYTTIGKVRDSHEIYTFDPKEIDQHIDMYFEYYQAIEDVKYKLDMLEIHNQDIIMNPRKTINEMCNFLGVSCSESYLDKCVKKIFKVQSKSRYRMVWEDQHLSKIKSHINKYDNLQRYIEFDS